MALWTRRVPPRLVLRTTGIPVRASMCWARSSARMTCSVKNLEPIVILAEREEWQEGKQSETAATRTKRERRISGDSQAALEEAEQEVREDGEKSGGDGGSRAGGLADGGRTAEDEGAHAAGGDGGGRRGRAHRGVAGRGSVTQVHVH